MAILDNFENWFEIEEPANLATKIFSETVCKDCQCESNTIQITDNMGRPVSWDQTKTN
jgi:hypothetical protein